MKNWSGNCEVPLVTVVAISYFHDNYLHAALDSILAQATSFPFEVIVHDDASQDGSAAIIREYAEKYPHIIHPIIEKENQFSSGIQALLRAVRPHIRGKYIAYLDCDDYWTDPHKLQEQVDYLEAHPAFLAVAHNCTVVDEDGNPTGEQYPECKDEEFTVEHFYNDILAGQLGTLLMRDILTQSIEDHPLIVNALPGPFDRVLNLTLLLNGRVHCIQKSMSAYRHITKSGTSFSATFHYDIQRDARFYLSFVNYCKQMGRIGDAIGMLRWFIEYAKKYKYDSFEERQKAESIIESCRSSISSLANQLMSPSYLSSANLAVYVQQQEDCFYSEEKSVYKEIELGKRYSCTISLSSFGEIAGLRIDPMQQPCILRQISVTLLTAEGEHISAPVRQSNAQFFRDVFIFDNDDPQIELNIPQGTYQSVCFSCELISCNPEEIRYLLDAADTEAKLLESEIEKQALTDQVSAAKEQLAAARHNYDVISNSTIWKVTSPARAVLDSIKNRVNKYSE